MRSGWLSCGLLWAALVVGACSQPNPAVCCNSPADCGSLGIMETSRPCSDNFVCIDHGCSTAPPVDAAPPECSVDTDCPAAHPHCSSTQTCVDCTTSSQCEASAPVCDATTMECRQCGADSDCDSDVCDVANGTCTSSNLVLYTSPTGPASGSCTHLDPCSLDFAISLADTTRNVIRMTGTVYAGHPSIVGKQITLDGSGATLNATTADQRAIFVGNNANVRVIGLKIENPIQGSGIGCEGNAATTLALSQVSIDSDGTALIANPCVVTVDHSSFHVNSTLAAIIGTSNSTVTIRHSLVDGGDGVQSLNSPSIVTIENSILLNQTGTDGALVGGTFSFGGTPPFPGSISASFTTFVNAKLICGNGTPMCQGSGTLGACVDNSIIVGVGTTDAVTGSACRVNSSIVTPQAGAVTGSNNQLNANPLFMNASAGDYSLTATSPAIDAVNPNAAVPADDYGGTLRPQGPRSDFGAFEYKP